MERDATVRLLEYAKNWQSSGCPCRGCLPGALALLLLVLSAGAEARPNTAADPKGPYSDEVWAAVSSDGEDYQVLKGPFFEHASVPAVVRRDGRFFVYFVDFRDRPGPGQEHITAAVSDDGRVWRELGRIEIAGKPNRGAAVDPCLVNLPDGRMRLYYFGSEVTGGDPASRAGEHMIYSAVSTDGIRFEAEPGSRFSAPNITDPEVVYTGKEWLMFLSSGQETNLARSKDGLRFNADDAVVFREGGVPGAVLEDGGQVRLFLSGKGSIWTLVWDPETGDYDRSLVREAVNPGDGLIVADPSCVKLDDGTYYLIFKHKPDTGRRAAE